MLCFGTRAFTVHLGPRIGTVDCNMRDRHDRYDLDTALCIGTIFEFGKYLILDLRIPRKVEIPGLNNRTRCRHGIAAALQLDRIEIRPVRHMVDGIALAFDQITGLEVDEPIRPGSHRFQVCRRLARIGAFIWLEEVFGDNQAVRTTRQKASVSRSEPAR
jgi:hypothetical protein